MSVFGMKNSGNPAFGGLFQQAVTQQRTPYQPGGLEATSASVPVASNVMTVGGSVNASLILVSLCGASFVVGWSALPKEWMYPLLLAGGIPGFLIAMVLMFKPTLARVLAPVYAILQGVFLGSLSSVVETVFAKNAFVQAKLGGTIAGSAGLMTLAIFVGMLLAYKFGLIKATKTFKTIMTVAIGGIAIFAIISMISRLAFSHTIVSLDTPLGLGVSIVIGVVAAFTLVLDFNFMQEGARAGLPKNMEWYAGFGLLSTLVWLYISILQILMSLASQRE